MKTVYIECRKYSEWDEKTQKKLLEKYREVNVEHDDWYEFVYEHWYNKLLEIGFDISEVKFKDEKKYDSSLGKCIPTGQRVSYTTYNISFTGFWSQGDGASFTSDVVYIDKVIEYLKNPKYNRIVKLIQSGALGCSATVIRDSHRYVHEKSTDLSISWNGLYKDYPNIESLLIDLEKDLDDLLVDLNSQIYKDLEETYEDLTSDEQVIDTFEANEWEFDNELKIR